MKAVLRLGAALLLAGAALAPGQALAQEAETNQPQTVGPSELQDFNLQGNSPQPAQPPAQQPAPPESGPVEAVPSPPATARPAPGDQPAEPRAPSSAARPTGPAARQAASPARAAEPLRQTPPASSVTVALPQLGSGLAQSSAVAPAPTPAQFPTVPGDLASDSGPALLPWLLAGLALALAAGVLLWRRRGVPALAGGPDLHAFVAPEPSPPQPARPAPRPAPRAAAEPRPASDRQPAPPASGGLVSTRLRPWLEIGFQPIRCIFDENQVAIDFAVELMNSGNAPARAVVAEATLFNASQDQEQVLNAFFAKPVTHDDRIALIEPLRSVELRTQVVAARANIQLFEIEGRQLFVPVIAFNASYRWSGGEGQTSVAFLLGRDGKGDKLGPFRADLGPRVFERLGARLLPMSLRR